MIVLFLLKLAFHFLKKCVYCDRNSLKPAFIESGRVRLEDEEEILGDDQTNQKSEKHKLENLAFFVESDYNYIIHKTIASGH
jgi:hypothetical protein